MPTPLDTLGGAVPSAPYITLRVLRSASGRVLEEPPGIRHPRSSGGIPKHGVQRLGSPGPGSHLVGHRHHRRSPSPIPTGAHSLEPRFLGHPLLSEVGTLVPDCAPPRPCMAKRARWPFASAER